MKYMLFILLFSSASIIAQDTLTILQYNLLNYGNFTSYCTSDNNNITEKDGYIRTIIDYIKPDIFCVNEISKSEAIHQRLLDNCLNVDGVNRYRMANFIKESDSYLVNMLYYNSEILQLHSHTIAQNYIRDIDVYKLYYRSDDLVSGDTAFIECVVAHLKAGNSTDNANTRGVMVTNAMNYLESFPENGNRLFMGDFNVYTSNETAYQLLTDYSNPDYQFYDPIDTPGSWNNNYSYRNVHTQSTHADQNGCASHGGMDDRFDFILISENIKSGEGNVEYLEGSYKALGQDGLHFNMSVNDAPTNTSAPASIINAIYGNSDHLPVLIDLMVNKTLGIPNLDNNVFTNISIINPADKTLYISIQSKKHSEVEIMISDLTGLIVNNEKQTIYPGRNNLVVNIETLISGIYLVTFRDEDNSSITKKVVKK